MGAFINVSDTAEHEAHTDLVEWCGHIFSAREIKDAKEMSLHEYRGKHGIDHQVMRPRALRMVCVGATAAPCERKWSA